MGSPVMVLIKKSWEIWDKAIVEIIVAYIDSQNSVGTYGLGSPLVDIL